MVAVLSITSYYPCVYVAVYMTFDLCIGVIIHLAVG